MSEPAVKKQKTESGAVDTALAASAAVASPSPSPSPAAVRPKTSAVMRDDLMQMEMIKQGAEGRVFACTFLGRPCIMKERFRKEYRHPQLDAKLTSSRMGQEVRCMAKARKQLPAKDKKTVMRETIYTPTVYHVDEEQQRIYMERIDGITVKDRVHQLKLDEPEDEKIGLELAVKIGKGLSDIHAAGILHGDLTTSNLMLVPTAADPLGKLVAIDFGLASVSEKNEERAVDLYVLERAFLSTHPNSEKMFAAILNTYRETFGLASKVLAWLLKVRLRGRKREMVG